MTKAAKTYPDTIFKQTTPDESQALNDGPRFNTWYKGWYTRSEVYERMMPDGLTSALRMEGPESGGAAMVMNSKGNIKLITGKRTDVAGSGTLDIKTNGSNQLHNGRSNYQYNTGGPESEKQALNVLCYGDYVEECIGSTRYIKATKVEITATEELILNGQTIKIQAQGDIEMAASAINTAQINKKDTVLGQSMKFGAGEDTDLQFDPRSSKSIVTTGHLNHKILGDYKQTVAGVANVVVAGGPIVPPFIKDRTNAYSVKTVVGGQSYTAADFINRTAGGAILDTAGATYTASAGTDASIGAVGSASIDAGVDASINAGAAANMTAGADATVTAGGTASIDAAAEASINSAGSVSVTGVGEVRITGSLIYLN